MWTAGPAPRGRGRHRGVCGVCVRPESRVCGYKTVMLLVCALRFVPHTTHPPTQVSQCHKLQLAATALHRVGRAKTAQSKQGANANASLTSSVGAQQRDRRVVEVRGDAARLPKQVVVVGMQCYGQVGLQSGACGDATRLLRSRSRPKPHAVRIRLNGHACWLWPRVLEVLRSVRGTDSA